MSVPLFFAQRRNFTDVTNLENGHRCRAPPVEATIYSLKATGNIEKFKSNFDARLISDQMLEKLLSSKMKEVKNHLSKFQLISQERMWPGLE